MCSIVDELLGMFQWLGTGLPRAFQPMSLGALRNMLKNRIARSQGLYNTEFIQWCQTLFQSDFCQFTLPLAVYEISLPELVRLLNFLPNRWEYGIFVVLIHNFFITNEAEHLFMFIGNVNSLFGEVAVQIFHLILNCLTAFFLLIYRSYFVVYIFW